jgi:HK97 family phage portal protein
MLALLEREAPRFAAKAADPNPGELYQTVSTLLPGQPGWPIPRPQRYEEFARAYGQVVWVYAAVASKARDTSIVPVKVTIQRDDQQVGTQVPRDHPLRSLLRKVNPFMTFQQLIEGTSANLDLVGNAYWLLFGPLRGAPSEIWPLRPDRVEVIPSADNYIAGYRYRSGTNVFDFTAAQMIHFREFNPWHDYYGQGSLSAAWESSVIIQDSHEWNRSLLRNAGRLDGVLSSDQRLDEKTAKEAGDKFRAMVTGPSNAGRVLVMGAGLKYQPIATTPKELDFVASAKLTREEILAALQVPPVVLFLESGDIGRRVEQIRHYFHSIIRGRCTRIAGTVQEFLVPRFGENLVVAFDVDSAIAQFEDRLTLAQTDDLLIKNRQRTPNELRKRDGLPALPGGDTPLVPSTMIPADQASVAAARAALPAAPASPEPTEPKTVHVHLTQPPAAAPDIHVHPAEVHVHPPDVHVHPAEVHLNAPVSVSPPDVHVHGAPITLSVEAPKAGARKVVYDGEGRILGTEPQEPA